MHQTLEQALSAADWSMITPRLTNYADLLIRRCFWRGIPVTATAGARVSVNGWDADDFVQEALDRLLNGTRSFREEIGLEQILMGTIRSLIWSANKSSGREPLIEPHAQLNDDNDDGGCIAENAADPALAADDSLLFRERVATQKALLDEFEATLGDLELLRLFRELKNDETAPPREIAAVMGVSAKRVSELKRTLRRQMDAFVSSRSPREPVTRMQQ